ncbi:MAG: (Fe-S)-binding protein [Acidimicrobiia bacterium]|nr:(Fe-S)-binding protein [Acidimicrobiia bacterium]
MTIDLGLDPDELATCVSCGLCLPHCPTFRVTGDEMRSPRGRIALMRAVETGAIEAGDEFVDAMDTCVQCRGCEPACPSSVPFGRLMTDTRVALAEQTSYQPWWRRIGYRTLGNHRLLLAGSSLLAVAQRLRLVPSRRLGLPARLPIRRPALRSSGCDVVLFTGCVMDAWMRDTHLAVQRVIESTGAGVTFLGAEGACCGALHDHAGLADQAHALAERVIAATPPDIPVLLDSAGCGAAMKDYGRLLGTRDAAAFSSRVLDVHEWLAADIDRLPEPTRVFDEPVAVQDACHLRHVQGAHDSVRTVLGRYVPIVELADDGLCCGAGGAYSVMQPELAAAIRERKVGFIDRSGARTVASANPGCAMHLQAAGLCVRHPLEIVDAAMRGLPLD